METNYFSDLIKVLKKNRKVVLQAHNYPDHDATAAAFGLARLLEHTGYDVLMCYGGELLSHSLKVAIRVLKIPVYHWKSLDLSEEDQVILVDGSFGNSNIDPLPGKVVAVVDHHPVKEKLDLPYVDLRTDYGSCSSMVFDYYRTADLTPDRDVATSLLMGIMMDTSYLTRQVHEGDLQAFSQLYSQGQWEKGSFILKNSLSVEDVPAIKLAVWNATFHKDFCFAYINRECSPDLLALIADDFLRFREVHFIVVAAKAEDYIRVSVRSEDNRKSAGAITKTALCEIGTGGGHTHMGGGIVPLESFPGRDELLDRFLGALGYSKEGEEVD